MPKPSEVAKLIVRGEEFGDWESVMVQRRWLQPDDIFRFSSAERPPMPPDYTTLQFMPGDPCTITLAGILAVTGLITVRQSAYEKENRGIQLIGKSRTAVVAKSSVSSKTGSFDGYSWSQIARSVLGKVGITLKIIGKIDETPFERMQHEPGEKIWNFLERIGRPLGIVMGADKSGALLAIGDHAVQAQKALVEGENILRANAIFTNEYLFAEYVASGQRHGDDAYWARRSSEIWAMAKGSDPMTSLLHIPMEEVATPERAQKYAHMAARWSESTFLDVTVVVQGWVATDGDLWNPGDAVLVRSPMMPLDMPLCIETATYTQDRASGTLTTLQLVLPWKLGGMMDWSGTPNMPQPPEDGRVVPPQ